ncbi:hypothetical protein PCANC_06735 [Puccinia coronata f. sp. avenae]|uniref:Uncharacterized protein n=1 Tax=Puccinia coronata f. sp. avenae TaxID=200324 RepID=A0A2N5VDQ9_9BASI|nr:hypothetical protein PCANC_06735 [Puccinia coronata f. sp. avenae]
MREEEKSLYGGHLRGNPSLFPRERPRASSLEARRDWLCKFAASASYTYSGLFEATAWSYKPFRTQDILLANHASFPDRDPSSSSRVQQIQRSQPFPINLFRRGASPAAIFRRAGTPIRPTRPLNANAGKSTSGLRNLCTAERIGL